MSDLWPEAHPLMAQDDSKKERRKQDHPWWLDIWLALPLVDRHTREWSLTRTMSAVFALGTLHLMESTHDREMTWAMATLIVSMALASLGAAFGKSVFQAIALRIAPSKPDITPNA